LEKHTVKDQLRRFSKNKNRFRIADAKRLENLATLRAEGYIAPGHGLRRMNYETAVVKLHVGPTKNLQFTTAETRVRDNARDIVEILQTRVFARDLKELAELIVGECSVDGGM
jgi:hypothetical protein